MPQELPGTPLLLRVGKKRGRKAIPDEQKRKPQSLSLAPDLVRVLAQEVADGKASSMSEAANVLIRAGLASRNLEIK